MNTTVKRLKTEINHHIQQEIELDALLDKEAERHALRNHSRRDLRVHLQNRIPHRSNTHSGYPKEWFLAKSAS